MRMGWCFFRSSLSLRLKSQVPHWNSFSPLWTRVCFFRLFALWETFPQNRQVWCILRSPLQNEILYTTHTKKQVLEIVTCYTQLHPIRHCSRNIHEKYESSRMSTIWLPGNHGATAVQWARCWPVLTFEVLGEMKQLENNSNKLRQNNLVFKILLGITICYF